MIDGRQFNIDPEKLRRVVEHSQCQLAQVPPISLSPLLRHFKVLDVRQRVLSCDARLIRDGAHLSIEVNSLSPRVRQRFSVAHELAHLILAGSNVVPTHAEANRALEALCDHIAGELLVPLPVLMDFLTGRGKRAVQETVTCRSVLDAAREFGVSVDLMARRMFKDMELIPRGLAIVWRLCDNPRAATRSTTSLRVSSFWCNSEQCFIPLYKTAASLSLIWQAAISSSSVRGVEKLSLGNLKGMFHVEASPFRWVRVSNGRPHTAVLSLLQPIAS